MKYAIEINFDTVTADLITAQWKIFVRNGLAKLPTQGRPYIPHISLAIMPRIDEDKYLKFIRDYTTKNSALELHMVSLGLFRDETNVLFIAPHATPALMKMNREIHEQLVEDKIENWFYYHPNRFNAHCSIAISDSFDEITKAFALCKNLELPFKVKAESLVLVDYEQGREICNAKFKDV